MAIGSWRKWCLLAAALVLPIMAAIDVTLAGDKLFEAYGEQFTDEAKTDAYAEAHPDAVAAGQGQKVVDSRSIDETAVTGTGGGSIIVSRAAGTDIALQYIVTVTAKKEAAAMRKRDAITVEERREGSRLSFEATAEGRPVRDGDVRIDYLLLIPDGVAARIETDGGNVLVRGLHGDFAADVERALVEVADVKGDVTIEADGGSVYVADLEGDLELVSRSGDVHAERTAGSVRYDFRSASGFFARIDGSVSGRSEGGAVRLYEIAGAVEVDGEGTALGLGGIRGDLGVTAASGPVEWTMAEGEGYTVEAAVQGGAIRANLPVEAPDAGDARLSHTVGDGRWRVSIDARYDDVVIHAY